MNRAQRRANRMPTWMCRHMLDPKTPAMLDQIAEEMADGLIFTNYNVRDMRQVPMVFPVVVTFGKKNAEWFSKNVGLLYEYTDKSVSIPKFEPKEGEEEKAENVSLPIFKTMQALNKEQGAIVLKKYNEIMVYRNPEAFKPEVVKDVVADGSTPSQTVIVEKV